MNDCTLDAAHIGDIADAWASGFGIYPALETASAPAGSARGKIFFSTQYIQFPNCAPPAFTLALATCGGTRDAMANWGTSVNSVTP